VYVCSEALSAPGVAV